jgi:hypothetical protein
MVKGTGSIPLNQVQQMLFSLRSANMAITTDQPFSKLFGGSKYIITNVVSKWVSGAFGTACLGGIYDTASKGGNALVAATQTFAPLTGANTGQVATLATIATTTISTANPILSLTTGNTGALVADIFIFGVCVD